MHKTTKRSGIIGILITVVILIVIVIISNIKINEVSFLESAFGVIVTPIQNGLTYLKNKLAGNDDFFTDVNKLQEENKSLKEKNKELEETVRELEIIKAENATLKEYVKLKEKYNQFETVPAYVVNKDISNYSNIIVINVGKRDGIEVNMPVISESGLVGYIISTAETTSKVQTIVDTSSTVSATITSSRDNLILRGTLEGSTLKATYIPTEAIISENESIETSGIGGIYPKGIYIGKIKKVINTKNIINRYAIIETAVDFSKIETVLVIKK